MMRVWLIICGLLASIPYGIAHDYKIGSISVEHPWARATPKGARVGGGYLKIANNGRLTDRLLGASASVAKRVVIHEMKLEGGVMRMRELSGGVEIPPGATVEFSPESLHLMFEDLAEPLVEGHRVKGALVFERAGVIEIEYAVEGLGAKPRARDASEHRH